MAQNWSGWCWHLGLASSLAIGGAIANSWDCAFAQITPDDTLGAERSVVTPSVDLNGLPSDQIDGGAIRGANLFHSFEQFSVPTGGAAYFNNALDIQNIISRVTGESISNIDGLIRANGTANLFLLNPNGIIFGPNATLNIGGSFLGSTASSLNFADGTQFSATAHPTTPLLTVSVPLGLQFGGTAGGIRVQGSGLEVQPGRTLALVGGDVTLEGGELAASEEPNLAARGGRIELGSVAGIGEVSLNQRGNGWVLGYDRVNTFRDIRLADGAFVDASGEGGGDIQIQGAQLQLTEESSIYADTEGTEAGGEVLVHTTGAIALSDESLITADVYGSGTGGDLTIEAGAITLSDDSRITANVLETGTGTGGNLTIETGQLSIRGGRSRVSTTTYGQGNGGKLTVTASDSVELGGPGSGLFAQSQGAGDAGNLTIATRRLSVQDGAQVFAGTLGEGQGGNLVVTASDSVELMRRSPDGLTPSGLLTETRGAQDAGDLTIATRRLSVEDGAQVSAATYGQGKSGELRVNATESVNLFGVGLNRSPSGLFTRTAGEGQGGNIIVDTSAFRVADNAVVDARTLAEGTGGNITVQANTFEAVNGGQILASAFRGSSGSAGNITVNTTDSVTISGSAPFKRLVRLGQNIFVEDESATSGLFVLSRGSGDAGKLDVTARSIRLDNQGELTAETNSGQGGDVNLQLQDLLLLRRGSKISTTAGTAGAGGNGGNITINNTPFIVAVPSENSDITANAFSGKGGFIQITAQQVFGIERREQLTPLSDITAFSQQNPELNGVVEINTPDVDPSRGLVALPAELVDVTGLIAQGCPAGGGDVGRGSSEFIITGRGGLPPQPGEALRTSAVVVNGDTLEAGVENRSAEVTSTPAQIVEAQGWVVNAQGQVVLTAHAPTVTPNSSWSTPTTCHAP